MSFCPAGLAPTGKRTSPPQWISKTRNLPTQLHFDITLVFLGVDNWNLCHAKLTAEKQERRGAGKTFDYARQQTVRSALSALLLHLVIHPNVESQLNSSSALLPNSGKNSLWTSTIKTG